MTDILKMKIYIVKNMVEYFPSVKSLNGEYLERGGSVDTKSEMVNKPSGSIPPALATSMKLQNNIS